MDAFTFNIETRADGLKVVSFEINQQTTTALEAEYEQKRSELSELGLAHVAMTLEVRAERKQTAKQELNTVYGFAKALDADMAVASYRGDSYRLCVSRRLVEQLQSWTTELDKLINFSGDHGRGVSPMTIGMDMAIYSFQSAIKSFFCPHFHGIYPHGVSEVVKDEDELYQHGVADRNARILKRVYRVMGFEFQTLTRQVFRCITDFVLMPKLAEFTSLVSEIEFNSADVAFIDFEGDSVNDEEEIRHMFQSHSRRKDHDALSNNLAQPVSLDSLVIEARRQKEYEQQKLKERDLEDQQLNSLVIDDLFSTPKQLFQSHQMNFTIDDEDELMYPPGL